MSTQPQRTQDSQRERCAEGQFLSGTCVWCNASFVPRQYNQVTCGASACRKGRFKAAIRKQEHKDYVDRTWARRSAKSMPVNLLGPRGPKARDREACREQLKLNKDKTQKFSRCRFCGAEFVDEKNRVTPSAFAFCGESPLTTGECKRKWLATLAQPKQAAPKFNRVSPSDVDWARKQTKLPRTHPMPRLLTNYCPQCREYVTQDHEHNAQ